MRKMAVFRYFAGKKQTQFKAIYFAHRPAWGGQHTLWLISGLNSR